MSRNRNTVAAVMAQYCADNLISLADVARYLKITPSNVTIWGTRFGKMPRKHYETLISHPKWNNTVLKKYALQLLRGTPIERDIEIPEEPVVIEQSYLLPVLSEEYLVKHSTIKESVRINESLLPHRPRLFNNIDCDFYVFAPCDFGDIHKGDLLAVAEGSEGEPYNIAVNGRKLTIEGDPSEGSYRITAVVRIY